MTFPNFIVIGAAKAGTTSLYHYLRQHPDVYMSPVKEPRYERWDDPSEVPEGTRGREEYERLFDGVGTERAIGEASPQYINSPTSAERIAADVPGVRIIASLRNPADRAYSSYIGRLRRGRERTTLEEAMRPGTLHFEMSLYYPRLLRYFRHFPRERIKILLFEDLVAKPESVMREVCAFLDIDPHRLGDVSERYNAGAVPRSLAANEMVIKLADIARRLIPSSLRGTGVIARLQRRLVLRPPHPLPDAMRRRLLDAFRDDIAKMGELMGRDLSHWLE
jgi:hypothetical protein